MDVITGLLPVFFALTVGYAAGKFRLIDNSNVAGFNTLVMTIALPIALFTILARSARVDVISHGAVAGVVALVIVISYLLVYLLERRVWRLSRPDAALQALTVAFPNTAAVGLPIADAVLGRTGELAVAVSLAAGTITVSPATIAVVERAPAPSAAGMSPIPETRRSLTRSVAAALRTPAVIAPILGVAWSLSGLPFPPLLQSALGELGDVTAGLALFLTGLVLSGQRVRPTGNVVVSTLIGDVVRPCLAIAAVKLFDLSSTMAAEVVILMAAPSGFFGVLLALSSGRDHRLTGATLFWSTLVSIGTLSLSILILPAL